MPNKQLQFRIGEADPHTLPMTRLLEYLRELASVLGSRENVHFLKVGQGSATCELEVSAGEEISVISRVQGIARGDGTQEALRAYENLSKFLRDDERSAELETEEGDVILDFPLPSEEQQEEYGPFWEDGTLDGIVMKLGGLDDTIPVHLVYSGTHYVCNANREMAIELGRHLFQKPIRVHGSGKWFRHADGRWELKWFNINRFDVLDDSSLSEAVTRLRAIPSNELRLLDDPLEEMRRIRHGE